MSVLLCEALKKSFPALETAAITAGSLGSCLPPVIGPRKGSLMEAPRSELSVVEIALKTKPHLMVSGHAWHACPEREGQADAQGRPGAGRGPLSLVLHAPTHSLSSLLSGAVCFWPRQGNHKCQGPGVGQNPFCSKFLLLELSLGLERPS